MQEVRAVHAVLFDLDGTLLDRRRSVDAFIRHQRRRFDEILAGVDDEEYAHTFIRLDEDGYSHRGELFTGLVAHFGLPPELADVLRGDFRARFADTCVLFPDVRATLAALRGAGLKLGLITNGSVRMQSRKVECLELAPALDTVVISDAEGISKPDPRIFHLALDRIGCDPGRAVFVGDRAEIDVAGARAAGLFAVWRRDRLYSQAVDADAVIDEIADLPAVIGLTAGP